MVKSLALSCSALAFACALPSHAQTLTAPPDVTYTPVTIAYATGVTLNTVGDGSNDKGGTAPAFSIYPELTDAKDYTVAQFQTQGWVVLDSSYCTTGSPDLATCPEKKFRLNIESAGIFCADPIKYYGQDMAGHCHEKFGYTQVNSRTTRASGRARPTSSSSGGNAWPNGYWEPCWKKTIAAKVYCIPAAANAAYYEEDPTALPLTDDLQMPHLKLRFVFGNNLEDPNNCREKNELDIANGGTGTSCTVTPGRYQWRSNGFVGFQCSSADGGTIRALKAGYANAPGFTLSDGTDPWEGRCGDGDRVYLEMVADRCWDGTNPWAPDGMANFRPEVFDTVAGKLVCFNHAYRVPQLRIKSSHQTHGWTDYQTWSFTSDATFETRRQAQCTLYGLTCGPAIPGASAHADWINLTGKVMRDQVFSFCLGIGTNVPHQCNVSSSGATISATQSLISSGAAPDGSRTPQVNTARTVDSTDTSQLFLISGSRQPKHVMKGM